MSKFKVGQKVIHELGGVYEITQEPDGRKRLEHYNDCFYAYMRLDGGEIEWYCRRDKFEDGRFILVDESA